MRKLLTFMVLLTAGSATYSATTPTVAAEWNCRNTDLEVSCNAVKCEVAKNHTPKDVYVSPSKISVCAYTGCWEGVPSATTISGTFEIFTGMALPFSTDPDSLANVSVTVNRTSKVAMILVEGRFASPAICTSK